MKRQVIASLLSVSLLGLPVLVGCDDTVAHKETTRTNSEGDTVRKETTVKERPDGSIVKEESKSVNDK
jgi:hypothetical protein